MVAENQSAAIRHVIVAAGLSFLLGLALNQLILLFAHRVRPSDGGVTHLLIARSTDFSFPSDHATAAFAIAAGFLLHGKRRLRLWFLAAAMLVTISRVYVGTTMQVTSSGRFSAAFMNVKGLFEGKFLRPAFGCNRIFMNESVMADFVAVLENGVDRCGIALDAPGRDKE